MIVRVSKYASVPLKTVALSFLPVIIVFILASCAGTPDPTEQIDEAISQFSRMTIVSPEEDGTVASAILEIVVDFSSTLADLSEIVAFQVELISSDMTGSTIDEPITVADFSRQAARFTIPLSLAGAIDGTDYSLRVRPVVRLTIPAGEFPVETVWSATRRWKLLLGLPVPILVAPSDGTSVLGTRPILQWDAPDGILFVLETSQDADFTTIRTDRTGDHTWEPDEGFSPERQVFWRVYAVGDGDGGGIRGRFSETFSFFPTLETPVFSPFAGYIPGVVRRPALRWFPMPGAVGYELEVESQETLLQIDLNDTVFPMDQNILSDLISDATGTLSTSILRWRVRAYSAHREYSAWSSTAVLEYKPSAPAMIPVLPRGEIVRFTVGSDRGDGDERPAVPVTLARPFAMARTEVTNRLVADLANAALARMLIYEQDGILYETGSNRPLIALNNLTLGEQFGLEPRRKTTGELTQIAVSPGREAHPAVGISWYGAVAIANALSYLSGYDPAYSDTQRVVGANGFRLPTEVEWHYAATKAFPDGFSSNGFSGGRVNYFRSGDAFEDVRAPYTAAGGPTVPVAFLANGGSPGIYDLLGNVWEWCQDWYDPAAYTMVPGTVDPLGPSAAVPDTYGLTKRVVRGGAWNTPADDLRLGNRGSYPPESFSYGIGVRLVRTLR